MTRTWVSRLGLAAAAGMFVVLVMGATVTTTGSAQGCGRDWPLCGGRFIPELAVGTLIEFSHRAVTGVEGILVLGLTIAALALYRRERPILVLAPLMFVSLVLQAGLGAWAVKYPQQPAVLALHFGVSLIALASTTLTALYIRGRVAMRSAPTVPVSLRMATWATAAYLYLLVYSGAFIRHAGDAAACPGWPLCGAPAGAAGPGALSVNLAHRLAAGMAVLLAAALIHGYARAPRPRPDLVSGGWLLLATLAGQAATGAYLVLSRWGLFGELAHAAVTGLTFTAAAYLCLRVTLGAVPDVPAAVEGREPERVGVP